jgi:micrococcal nuclease
MYTNYNVHRSWHSHRFLAVRIGLGLCLAAACGISPRAQDVGVVERIVDGDTVIITGVGAVRLIGVDTPETVHPNKPVEAFGKEASAFLRGLVLGQTVRMEYDVDRRDRYHRTLAYLYLADGRLVNELIVREGYGHAYTQFPFKYLEHFRQLERDAREQKRGLWREP